MDSRRGWTHVDLFRRASIHQDPSLKDHTLPLDPLALLDLLDPRLTTTGLERSRLPRILDQCISHIHLPHSTAYRLRQPSDSSHTSII